MLAQASTVESPFRPRLLRSRLLLLLLLLLLLSLFRPVLLFPTPAESQKRTCVVNFKHMEPCKFDSLLIVSFAKCNDFVPPKKAFERPMVRMKNSVTDKMYILFMVDPDSPTPEDPYNAFYISWIAYNIPGLSLANGRFKGTHYKSYEAPTFLRGEHRYQMFVFEQPDDFVVGILPISREKFDIQAFATLHQLCDTLVGAFQFRSAMVTEAPPTTVTTGPSTTPVTQLSSTKGEERAGVKAGARRSGTSARLLQLAVSLSCCLLLSEGR